MPRRAMSDLQTYTDRLAVWRKVGEEETLALAEELQVAAPDVAASVELDAGSTRRERLFWTGDKLEVSHAIQRSMIRKPLLQAPREIRAQALLRFDALVEEIFRELRKRIRKAGLDETLP